MRLYKLLLGFALLSAAHAMAEPLTASRYVALDLKVLQATLNDAKARLTLLELGGKFGDEIQESNRASTDITQIYRDAGTTVIEALRWHARHQSQVDALLVEQPELAHRYRMLKAELDAVSHQLQALREQADYKD